MNLQCEFHTVCRETMNDDQKINKTQRVFNAVKKPYKKPYKKTLKPYKTADPTLIKTE